MTTRTAFQATAQFADMVANAAEWIYENEEDLTDGGQDADLLNDRFVDMIFEICDNDPELVEAVRGEAAVLVDSCGKYPCTRAWASQWA